MRVSEPWPDDLSRELSTKSVDKINRSQFCSATLCPIGIWEVSHGQLQPAFGDGACRDQSPSVPGTVAAGHRRGLSRAPSAVAPVLARNGWSRGRYHAHTADRRARHRRRRCRFRRLDPHPRLRHWVCQRLRWRWSPEEIARWIKRDFPGAEALCTCLYVLPRGELRRELLGYLRHDYQRRRHRRAQPSQRGRIPVMTQHWLFTRDTKIQVYFAHPVSPWERGTNKNTNGLIRQFFPKGMDFTEVSYHRLKRVQHLLNGCPRAVLGWKTPYEAFEELLH